MSTHTPGPWREILWQGQPTIVHDHSDDGGFDVIVTASFTAANARLIAAAPDLLAVLRVIRDAFYSDGETAAEQVADLKEIARAAIAKAEGAP